MDKEKKKSNGGAKKSKVKNPNIPVIDWPSSFEVCLSNNDPGLNITETIYFDTIKKKLRLQVFYSILGLEPTKAIDIVIDQGKQTIALRTDLDCKKTKFWKKLDILSLFFSRFNDLTVFQGIEEGFNNFEMIKFSNSNTSPKFSYYFDQNETQKLQKVKLEHSWFGTFFFDALTPVKERIFEASEFEIENCDDIDKIILEEAFTFVTFMQSLVFDLFGKEEVIQSFLNNQPDESIFASSSSSSKKKSSLFTDFNKQTKK